MATTAALIIHGEIFTLHPQYNAQKIAILAKLLQDVKVVSMNTHTRTYTDIEVDDHYTNGIITLDVDDYTNHSDYKRVYNAISANPDIRVIGSSHSHYDGRPYAILSVTSDDITTEMSAMSALFPGKFLLGRLEKGKSEKVRSYWNDIRFIAIKPIAKLSPLCEFIPDDSESSVKLIMDYMYYAMGRFNSMFSGGADFLINVAKVSNIQNLLSIGLYPYGNNGSLVDSRSIDMAIEGHSEDVIGIWYGPPASHTDVYFFAKNIDTLIKTAVEECSSNIIKYVSPKLLFTSMRPKTDMSIFRLPGATTIPERTTEYFSNGEYFHLIPVTRYAAGMSKGLYYCSSDKCDQDEYCGTFYYYEPESPCFLAVKPERIATYRNKLEAYIKLVGVDKLKKFPYLKELTPLVYAQLVGVFPEDMRLTPSQMLEVANREWVIPFDDMKDPMPDDINKWPKRVNIKMSNNEHGGKLALDVAKFMSISSSDYRGYAPIHLDMYAAEDSFDQPICEAARNKGIDVIHLTNMIGSFQIVHEILDTRDRVNSFKSLIFIDEKNNTDI